MTIRKFSYCIVCWIAQYFVLSGNQWICTECGTPLKKAMEANND